MTTALLSPLLPGVGLRRVALVLERLEDEVRACGALYGVLIDRAGQVVAADGLPDRQALAALATRLVPVFLVSRSLSQTFHESPVRAILDEGDHARLLTLPLGNEWLLAMGFAVDAPLDTELLAARWMARLAPLTPRPSAEQARLRERAGGQKSIIRQDSVSLLFGDDQDERDGKDSDDKREGDGRWR